MGFVEVLVQIVLVSIFALAGILTLVFFLRALVMSYATHASTRKSPYENLRMRDWPTVTILIPAHNEERVIGGCLTAMMRLDYPVDKLDIIVINDRSTDRTREIIDAHAAQDERIQPHHRSAGSRPGKPAAIKEVCDKIKSEIAIFFDADYLPPPRILKQLVTPFVDPQVGATMGRVIPYNTNTNLLTKLIDIERRAGYAVDQRMRSMWNLLPQFGGTVGAVRMAALRSVGGWREDALTEDTDLTYRLFLGGWTVEYINHATCYEESPEDWCARFKQVRRWAYGHNVCMFKFMAPVVRARELGTLRKLDAILILLFYIFPVVSFAALVTAIVYPVFYAYPPFSFSVIPALSFVMAFGNFSPYFQIIVGCLRDGQPRAASLAPLLFISSSISMMASVAAFGLLVRNSLAGRSFAWDKTPRFREQASV